MPNTCTTEICQQVLGLLGQGLTQDEICADVGITRQTFWNWRNPKGPHYEKEFDKMWEHGELKQFAWWARRGRDNIGQGKDFNTPLFALYMANMFGWSGTQSKEDQAMKEIRKLKEQFGIPQDA